MSKKKKTLLNYLYHVIKSELVLLTFTKTDENTWILIFKINVCITKENKIYKWLFVK